MKNRLYDDVIAMQYVRHATVAPEGLARCGKYICDKLADMGIAPETQEFYVPGFDEPMFNYTGRIGGGDKPLIVLGAHYDTVAVAPGAEDDNSGIALMLEVARHFAPIKDKVNLAFAFFTLEEFENPAFTKAMHTAGRRLGILTDSLSYTKLEYLNTYKAFFTKVFSYDMPFGEAYKKALDDKKNDISPEMLEYFESGYAVAKDFRVENAIGEGSLIGSCRWVEANKPKLGNMAAALIFDEISVCYEEPNTARLPIPDLVDMAQTFNVDKQKQNGNYIVMINNGGSKEAADAICAASEKEQFPYARFSSDSCFAELSPMEKNVYLGADNASFWMHDLPVVLFTDTGHGMRGLYSHTQADTVEHMNFDFLERLTKAVIRGISEFYGL